MKNIKIGNRIFKLEGRTFIMGILNATPDSFSDGGNYIGREQALRHAERMIREGADLIDVGGESTRPGHVTISDQEEIERIAPVIRAIKENFDIPISIDTYKSRVAREAISSGADLINDTRGLKYDPDMAALISSHELPVCIMHNREHIDYRDFMPELLRDLEESLEIAASSGIANDRIILDPGIGFGKTHEMNLYLLQNLEKLSVYGHPLLLGVSRKSVIGLALELPVGEREEGTLALSALAVMKGYQFIRVHNVEKNIRAVRMMEAVLNAAL